jgi:hypothetical protein
MIWITMCYLVWREVLHLLTGMLALFRSLTTKRQRLSINMRRRYLIRIKFILISLMHCMLSWCMREAQGEDITTLVFLMAKIGLNSMIQLSLLQQDQT